MTAIAPTVVATVAGQPIRLELVELRVLELRAGPRGRQMPPAGTPGYRDLCRWVLRELVREAIVAHEARVRGIPVTAVPAAVTGDAVVPEEELRAYYDRNEDLFRRPETRTVDWAGVGRIEVRRGELVGPFEDGLFAARPGDDVGPVAGPIGRTVRLLAVLPESVVPFEEARHEIERELLAVARERAFDAWLESRRHELVVVEPEWEHPAHPVHGLPSHRH